jgi:hypothetical protein
MLLNAMVFLAISWKEHVILFYKMMMTVVTDQYGEFDYFLSH